MCILATLTKIGVNMSGLIGTSHSKSKVIGRSKDTAKAWVNFNGTGTLAVRDSFGVSSVTDVTQGHYRVNFQTAMANANYAPVFYGNANTGTTASSFNNDFAGGLGGFTTAYLECRTYSSSNIDSELIYVIVFGD